MRNKHLGIAVLLAGMLLMACNLPEVIVKGIENSVMAGEDTGSGAELPGEGILSATAIPTESAVTCLAGTWEINGIHDYILAAIPAEAVEQYALEYKGNSGSAYLILSPDGQARLQADGLELLFEAQASIFTVPVTASLDGEAVGRYTANGGVLTTTGMDTSGLSASAQAMGQELASSEQILRAIPMLKPPANSAEYICEGDTLSMRVGAYPASVPALEFVRVE